MEKEIKKFLEGKENKEAVKKYIEKYLETYQGNLCVINLSNEEAFDLHFMLVEKVLDPLKITDKYIVEEIVKSKTLEGQYIIYTFGSKVLKVNIVEEKISWDWEEEIIANKMLRVSLDKELQRLQKLPDSRERNLAKTKLQESIMWIGVDLSRLRAPSPYVDSFDPTNTNIAETAEKHKG